MPSRSFDARTAILLALALVMLLPAWGCQRRMRAVRDLVEISGPAVTTAAPAAVDVQNANGAVRVFADKRVKEAQVHARVRAPRRAALTKAEIADAALIDAETVEQDGGQVLRVRARPAEDAPDGLTIDLDIHVPSIRGVLVHNAGGPVELVGVGGPIRVENGYGGGPGGRVEVRTDRPMTDAVMISTSEGVVHYQVGFNSTGRFEISSEDGHAEFIANSGLVRQARPGPGRWTGIYNQGTNPVVLRTGRGASRAVIISDPVQYGPMRDEEWPRLQRMPWSRRSS